MEAWREELYHHGILGQKWGVRNGPPYPLDESQYSGKERAIAERANREVGGYMRDVADRHARTVYNERYGDKKVGTQEYYDKINELARAYAESPEYRELMSQKYSEVLNREQRIQAEGEKKTKTALAIIGTALIASGVLKYGIGKLVGGYYKDRHDMRRINASEAEKERKHEFNLAYGIGAKKK